MKSFIDQFDPVVNSCHRRSDHIDIWFFIPDRKNWNSSCIRVYPDGSTEQKGMRGLTGYFGRTCPGCGRTKPFLSSPQAKTLSRLTTRHEALMNSHYSACDLTHLPPEGGRNDQTTKEEQWKSSPPKPASPPTK